MKTNVLFTYLMQDNGILVSVSMVSYRILNLNAKDSKTARVMCPFVVDGFIPINNVDALSSFIGAYDREIDE